MKPSEAPLSTDLQVCFLLLNYNEDEIVERAIASVHASLPDATVFVGITGTTPLSKFERKGVRPLLTLPVREETGGFSASRNHLWAKARTEAWPTRIRPVVWVWMDADEVLEVANGCNILERFKMFADMEPTYDGKRASVYVGSIPIYLPHGEVISRPNVFFDDGTAEHSFIGVIHETAITVLDDEEADHRMISFQDIVLRNSDDSAQNRDRPEKYERYCEQMRREIHFLSRELPRDLENGFYPLRGYDTTYALRYMMLSLSLGRTEASLGLLREAIGHLQDGLNMADLLEVYRGYTNHAYVAQCRLAMARAKVVAVTENHELAKSVPTGSGKTMALDAVHDVISAFTAFPRAPELSFHVADIYLRLGNYYAALPFVQNAVMLLSNGVDAGGTAKYDLNPFTDTDVLVNGVVYLHVLTTYVGHKCRAIHDKQKRLLPQFLPFWEVLVKCVQERIERRNSGARLTPIETATISVYENLIQDTDFAAAVLAAKMRATAGEA